jgi:hypothetical protein
MNRPTTAAAIGGLAGLLARRYVEGDRANYVMHGTDNGTTYEVGVTSTTRRNANGFLDELTWSNLTVDGQPRPLSPVAQGTRLIVTTEGAMPFQPPDLSSVDRLLGPITDAMTFYADLFLARRLALGQPGDRRVFHNAPVASWADGRTILTGEDHVDFDLLFKEIDRASGVGVLLIKHMPPDEPKIRLTADWMRVRVADTANNWVMVTKLPGGYSASVGKETFDVELRVSLAEGRLVSATLDNPVVATTRECADETLTQCSTARPISIVRRVTMSRVRE